MTTFSRMQKLAGLTEAEDEDDVDYFNVEAPPEWNEVKGLYLFPIEYARWDTSVGQPVFLGKVDDIDNVSEFKQFVESNPKIKKLLRDEVGSYGDLIELPFNLLNQRLFGVDPVIVDVLGLEPGTYVAYLLGDKKAYRTAAMLYKTGYENIDQVVDAYDSQINAISDKILELREVLIDLRDKQPNQNKLNEVAFWVKDLNKNPEANRILTAIEELELKQLNLEKEKVEVLKNLESDRNTKNYAEQYLNLFKAGTFKVLDTPDLGYNHNVDALSKKMFPILKQKGLIFTNDDGELVLADEFIEELVTGVTDRYHAVGEIMTCEFQKGEEEMVILAILPVEENKLKDVEYVHERYGEEVEASTW